MRIHGPFNMIFLGLFSTIVLPSFAQIRSSTKLIYKCDFNSNNCNSTLSTNGTLPNFQITPSILITSTSFRITDVSSTIIEKTSNGEFCQIPFIYNKVEYFHCTPLNECQTQLGLAKCFRGSFLHSRTSYVGEPFTSALKIPEFEVDSGQYLLKFYIFMHCNDTDECQHSKDFHSVIINSNIEDDEGNVLKKELISKSYSINDVLNERRWEQNTIEFNITDEKARLNITFYTGRFFKIPPIAHYGLDHIELFKLDADDETEHSSTVITNTQNIITSSKPANSSPPIQNLTTSLASTVLTNLTSKPTAATTTPTATTSTAKASTSIPTTTTSIKQEGEEEETNLKKTLSSVLVLVIISIVFSVIMVLLIVVLFFQYFRLRKKIDEQVGSNNPRPSSTTESNNSYPMTTQF